MNRREIEKAAVECLLALEARGVTVKIMSGAQDVRRSLEIFDKTAGVANDPEMLLLTPANAFWVFAYRKEEPLAAFGVRVDDLGSEDAQDFLSRSLEVIYGVKVTGSHARVFSQKRWGRAAYFGGLRSKSASGLGRQGRQILQLVTAYAHHCAFLDLGADVNYCFLRGADGSRALAYGFLDADPFVWETDRPLYTDGNPEWVMQLPRSKMPSLMAITSRLLRGRLAENQETVIPIKVDHPASG